MDSFHFGMTLEADTGRRRGYEAGGLGYSLYRKLREKDIECRIMAPSTMSNSAKGKVNKNDYRDASNIATCLAWGTYKAVYVPTLEDESVKEYIRMRDGASIRTKQIKQQIVNE